LHLPFLSVVELFDTTASSSKSKLFRAEYAAASGDSSGKERDYYVALALRSNNDRCEANSHHQRNVTRYQLQPACCCIFL
jgi:hypothetical protein